MDQSVEITVAGLTVGTIVIEAFAFCNRREMTARRAF
jgi:hypothetical protein